ncbi:MAG: O-antigen ligase family protein [Chthoniobacterales bacterium]
MWCLAGWLAAGLALSQLLLGSWLYPALAAPGLAAVGLAGVLAAAAFWKTKDAPGAWCVGATLLFAGYLFWRQSVSPDAYVARDDAWLLLGALAVYLTVAWQLRGNGPRWLVLAVLFAMMLGQVVLVVAQFAAEAPFHPLAEVVLKFRLPQGDEGLVNRGWVTGTFATRGTLSAVLQATTFLALGLLVWGPGNAAVRIMLLWVAAAGFAGLVLSLSRAAYLGLSAGAVVFALVSFFIVNRGAVVHRFWLGVGALGLVVVPLALAALVGAESFLVRFRLEELGGDAYRQGLWFTTVPPMLKLDPWFGAGANMFDQLSFRYRGGAFEGRPVHAHNDWLQLLVEYGRVGLALGVVMFVLHFAAGWKNALRLARESVTSGWRPQSMELGLVSGALAAWAAQGVHSFFDFRLHLVPVALLMALSAGWLAGARVGPLAQGLHSVPRWLRLLALMPALPGMVLVWWTWQDAPAEYRALRVENALLRNDTESMLEQLGAGRVLNADHPRLRALSAEFARLQRGVDLNQPSSGLWAEQCADDWEKVVSQQPYSALALREYALAQTHRGLLAQSLPFHQRAIAVDPDHATGYEYLGYYFLRQKCPEEALRLFRLARTFPGAVVTSQDVAELEEYVRNLGP